jgi:hypothetical protein
MDAHVCACAIAILSESPKSRATTQTPRYDTIRYDRPVPRKAIERRVVGKQSSFDHASRTMKIQRFILTKLELDVYR